MLARPLIAGNGGDDASGCDRGDLDGLGALGDDLLIRARLRDW
jgi:hypothetical protein